MTENSYKCKSDGKITSNCTSWYFVKETEIFLSYLKEPKAKLVSNATNLKAMHLIVDTARLYSRKPMFLPATRINITTFVSSIKHLIYSVFLYPHSIQRVWVSVWSWRALNSDNHYLSAPPPWLELTYFRVVFS